MAESNQNADKKVSPNNADADAAFASEAGNATRDRQPATPEAALRGDREGPDQASTASAREVRNRSGQANDHHAAGHDQADHIHPGPNQRDSETKKDTKAG